jgi:RNA polymerase sigma-70 factor (ECF subfamily)
VTREGARDADAAHALGKGAFPELSLGPDAFAAHLARLAASAADDPEAGSAEIPFAADLYLAAACTAGVAGAAVAFQARHGETIRAAIRGIVRDGDELGEIEQQLVEEMLLGADARQPTIATYRGRAPLDRWVQVAAQRAALLWRRRFKTDKRVREAAGIEANLGGETHPEIAFLKERYRPEFEQALKEALEKLPPRERGLLRLQLVSGVSVDKIGKMFGVSQSTASRWLAAARATVLDEIIVRLRERLGVSAEQLASLAGLVASGLDLSLSQLLKTG